MYYGPEYVSTLLTEWAGARSIMLTTIQPGKPQQKAPVERHNQTIRYAGSISCGDRMAH